MDAPIDGFTDFRLDKAAKKTLGPLLCEFRTSKINLLAGFILGGLVTSAGIIGSLFLLREGFKVGWSMPFYTEEKYKMCWAAMGLGLLVCLMAMTIAYLIANFLYWHVSHRVTIHATGFAYRYARQQELIPWTAVTEIHEKILYEKWPILRPPANWLLPRNKSTSYEVRRADGRQFDFCGNSISNLKGFEVILRERATELSIPWRVSTEHA